MPVRVMAPSAKMHTTRPRFSSSRAFAIAATMSRGPSVAHRNRANLAEEPTHMAVLAKYGFQIMKRTLRSIAAEIKMPSTKDT